MLARARQRAASILRDERGIALPTAMLVTVIGLGLATVPIMASVNTQSGDRRDQASDAALAAANSAAQLAISRQTSAAGTTAAESCVYENGTTLSRKAPASATSGSELKEWCPVVTVPASLRPLGTEAFYRVKPTYSTTSSILVVGLGKATSGGRTVTRRVRVNATGGSSSTTKKSVFAGGQVVGIDSLTMSNDAVVVNGGGGSNGSVSMTGSANICGSVQYGTTFTAVNGSDTPSANCSSNPRVTKQGTSEYPDVSPPANIGSVNSDARLAGEDQTSEASRGNLSWNPANRSLTLNYGTLTLGGTNPYWLCSLTLAGGSTLKTATGKTTTIYFDNPANCPGLNGGAQLTIANGTHVSSDAANGPAFYFVGSTSPGASKIVMAGGGTNDQFVIYAPHSAIDLSNGIDMSGAIIGQTIVLSGGARINERGVFTPPASSEVTVTGPASGAFAEGAYVECGAATDLTAPVTGC